MLDPPSVTLDDTTTPTASHPVITLPLPLPPRTASPWTPQAVASHGTPGHTHASPRRVQPLFLPLKRAASAGTCTSPV